MMIIAVPSAAMAKATVRRMDRRAMVLSLGGGVLHGGRRPGRSLDHDQGLGAGAGVVALSADGGSECRQRRFAEEDHLDLTDARAVGRQAVEGTDGAGCGAGGAQALVRDES